MSFLILAQVTVICEVEFGVFSTCYWHSSSVLLNRIFSYLFLCQIMVLFFLVLSCLRCFSPLWPHSVLNGQEFRRAKMKTLVETRLRVVTCGRLRGRVTSLIARKQQPHLKPCLRPVAEQILGPPDVWYMWRETAHLPSLSHCYLSDWQLQHHTKVLLRYVLAHCYCRRKVRAHIGADGEMMSNAPSALTTSSVAKVARQTRTRSAICCQFPTRWRTGNLRWRRCSISWHATCGARVTSFALSLASAAETAIGQLRAWAFRANAQEGHWQSVKGSRGSIWWMWCKMSRARVLGSNKHASRT